MVLPKRPKVLLADDHTMVAAGLAKLLEDEFDLVATVEDGRTAIAAARQHRPDVVLLDITMPVMNGIEATRRIHAESPRCKLIIVTMHSDRAFVEQAFGAGASGYVLKRSAASELPLAIHQVLEGKLFITPLLNEPAPEKLAKAAGSGHQLLSARQREVLQLVAEGNSAKQVAAILKISSKTVEFHKALILKKLKLRTMADMIRYALQEGMVGK